MHYSTFEFKLGRWFRIAEVSEFDPERARLSDEAIGKIVKMAVTYYGEHPEDLLPDIKFKKPFRKLKSIYKKSYAYCYKCNEFFYDDIPIVGSLLCPNACSQVVQRGIRDPKAFFYTIKNPKG